MTADSRQPRKLRNSREVLKSRKLRRRMVATGFFAVAILVSLVASQCSSSEDSVADTPASVDATSTTRAEVTTTTEVDATTTIEVDATTTTEAAPPTTSTPETSPPTTGTTDISDPENAKSEEQVEESEEPVAEQEEQIEEQEEQEETDSAISTTTVPRSSDTPASQTVRVSLSSFDECDALLDYIRGEASERVGPYGFEDDDDIIGPFFAVDEAMAEDDAPLASAAPAAPPALDLGDSAGGPPAESRTSSEASALAQGEDFSGTNVQVEGVDEADIVKTDGRRIIGVSSSRSGNNEIWIADIANPLPKLQGRLILSDGSYSELYLAGDRVFVIGTSTVGIDPPGGGGTFENGEAGSSEADIAGEALSIAPRRYANAVVITEVDISDPENPEAMRHLRVEGSYVSSRAASGYARVVISSPPESLGFVRPSSYGSASSEASAERFNKLIVQESTLEQWLPNYNLHSANGESVSRGQLLDCDRVFAPSEFSGFNQVSVLSFATGESLELRDAVSTMADGETVYASPGNLYVSRVVYDYDPDSNRRKAETVIHKFSLDSSGSADYEASGTAIGSPVNQYAFHEYEGRLFVATTSGGWEDSESFVTVLEDEGGALKQVGQVGNLGRNEDIYAVRYIADKAYVVTFRRTDPLYVIDLSDPTDPTTEGELKITGYSAYLHPVGDNLLLGVGREATTTGRVTGAKVSLFDVSDPSDPRTLDSLVLEGGSSEVEWDARAFLWWAPKKLAVVPISNWRNNYYGALALRVTADADSPEIELISRVGHDVATRPTGDTEGCEWYDVPSASLGWTAESLSTMSVVKVCPATSRDRSAARGVPDNHACSQLTKPRNEDQEDLTAATLGEIIEEVRSATVANDTGELTGLLSKLLSNSVEEASQVSACIPQYFRYDSSSEIFRSIVITDDLWTLSRSYLQANDLDTLARRAWLDIPG